MTMFFDDVDTVVTLYGPPQTTIYGQPKPGLPRKRMMLLLLKQGYDSGYWRSKFAVKECLVDKADIVSGRLADTFKDEADVYSISGLGNELGDKAHYFELLVRSLSKKVLGIVDSPYAGRRFDYRLDVVMVRWSGEVLDAPLREMLEFKREVTESRVAVA